MKQNIVPLLTVTIVLLINIVDAGWDNEFGQTLETNCNGQVLNKIKSEFSKAEQDRRTELGCTDLPGVTPTDDAYCLTFDGITSQIIFGLPKTGQPGKSYFWKDWKFSCGRRVMTGITSVHKSKKGSFAVLEDRVFSFRCCPPADITKTNKNCKWTGWQNDFDGNFDYTAPDKHYIKGVESVFHKDKLDRRFKFEICSVE